MKNVRRVTVGTGKSVVIRNELPADVAEIGRINDAAFGQPQEGRIIAALRDTGAVLLSLVAVVDGRLAGHVLFSPATVIRESNGVTGAALGPMAVLPRYQRQNCGTKLVETGIELLRKAAYPFIVLVGHPEYYPRFGFRPASAFGLRCEWDVPDSAFMALILDEARMKSVCGLVRYRPEFAAVG